MIPTTPKQREKHPAGTMRSALEQASGGTIPAGTRYSGTQIENFREGWAIALGEGKPKVAHYFKRAEFDQVESLCGLERSVRGMYGKGNFEDCALCVRHRAARVY